MSGPSSFFWIGRDDVGNARLTWREGADRRRALELLIGSDLSRAPRDINRWGFVVEARQDGRTEVLGLMTASDEETLEALLALVPDVPPDVETIELPPGTESGFLFAMERLIGASLGPCVEDGGAADLPTVTYVYREPHGVLGRLRRVRTPPWDPGAGPLPAAMVDRADTGAGGAGRRRALDRRGIGLVRSGT